MVGRRGVERERGSSMAGTQAQKQGGHGREAGVIGKSGGLDWGRGRGPREAELPGAAGGGGRSRLRCGAGA